MPVWTVLPGGTVSLIHTRKDVSHLVDMSLHTARKTCFTDRTAACGVFIARPTSQTLCQGTHRSGSDTGDRSYTYDLHGTFFGPMFALYTASFADKALLLLRSSLKVAHHTGRLCEMSNKFMSAAEGAVSAPGDHRNQDIRCKSPNLSPTLGVG
jgi:hypothetical protein